MNRIQKAIELTLNEIKKDLGKNVLFEEGEEIVSVFNDGIIIISKEEGTPKVQVKIGKPYHIDFNLED